MTHLRHALPRRKGGSALTRTCLYACCLTALGVSTAAQLGARRLFAAHRWVRSLSAVLNIWENAIVPCTRAVKVLETCPVFLHRVIEFYRTQRDAMICSAEKWLKGQYHTLLLLYFVIKMHIKYNIVALYAVKVVVFKF